MSEQQATEEWRGQVGRMDQAQVDEFLKEGRVCRLACLDEAGWPYAVPVWFHYADGGYYIIPRERSVWARYLQRDGRVSLTIDEETAPYRKVLVQGQAETLEEPNVGGKWVEIANQMAYRYLGEHGPDYLVPTLNEPRWLFFVRPVRVTTWQGVDWARRYKHYEWGA
jgi:nitroimidazol reductase NimA-like FMN-containing flavoprotein (pyridoxamine 5'-phosphate oxidase superfamily)